LLARTKMQIPRFTRDDKPVKEEEAKVKRRVFMFTGTLIDELISTVEHAEKQAHKTTESPEANLTYWYTAIEREPGFDSKLLGVA